MNENGEASVEGADNEDELPLVLDAIPKNAIWLADAFKLPSTRSNLSQAAKRFLMLCGWMLYGKVEKPKKLQDTIPKHSNAALEERWHRRKKPTSVAID